MNAIIKYPGAKWGLAEWIIDHFPAHHSYLEPFFGSGGVLFTKPRSRIETVNDLDDDVVNLFRWIRDDPALLDQIRAEEAQKTAAATAELEKKLAAAEAKATKEAEKAKRLKDKVDKAGEEAKAAMQKDMDAAEEARKAAEADKADAVARAEALEQKLKTANSEAAVFKVYYQGVQEDLNRMLGMIQKSDSAQKAKFKAALRALLDTVGGAL